MLHLITRLAVGGAQDNTLLTCETHDPSRFQVHIAANPNGPLLERAIKASEKFHPIPHLVAPMSPVNDFRALIEIYKLLKREKFDLIHLHSAKAGFLGRLAGRLAGTRIVYTNHGFSFHEFMPFWQRQLFLNLERLAKPWADYYITLSSADKEAGIEMGFLPKSATQPVFTGIRLQHFDNKIDPLRKRAELGLTDATVAIALVGRMDPQKAPDLLFEAFKIVHKAEPHTALLFVGDGELKAPLEALVTQNNLESAVYFVGTRKDVPEILQAVDIFAFSSRWEAMGRAMLEAMIVGKAVVAPAIYGIPEVVLHEKTGLLYPVGNVQALAENILRLVRDKELRERLGSAASEFIRPRFDHREMVRAIEEIYERVLEPK